jgi:hypothetical protein
MIRGFVCGSGAKDLLKLVNYRILFPWLCTIPIECTLALREVDIGLGWELVDSPQLNRLNNPACPLHWRMLLTILRLLDRTQQDAMWEYRPTNIWTVCGYVPPPVLVASVVPAFVVEGLTGQHALPHKKYILQLLNPRKEFPINQYFH